MAAHQKPTRVLDNPAIVATEQKTGKKLAPFIAPVADCSPPPPPALTPEQQTKYDSLVAWAESLAALPVSSEKAAATAPLSDAEKLWLTRECFLRYLRATKWVVPECQKRIEATLVWRREYGVLDHTAEYIEPENETGKQYILGFDNGGRPCLYLNPARQNTKQSPRQIQHLVFMLERVIDMMGPGQETLALLIDFKSSTNSSNPSVSQGRQVLNILQMHYPERLGRALIINIPWFVWGFFKIINPFIDPLTREKLVFNEPLRNHVPPSQLDKRFGGDVDFEYVHTTYWPELIRLTGERRKCCEIRWREEGAKVGAEEGVLRCERPAVVPDVIVQVPTQVETTAAATAAVEEEKKKEVETTAVAAPAAAAATATPTAETEKTEKAMEELNIKA